MNYFKRSQYNEEKTKKATHLGLREAHNPLPTLPMACLPFSSLLPSLVFGWKWEWDVDGWGSMKSHGLDAWDLFGASGLGVRYTYTIYIECVNALLYIYMYVLYMCIPYKTPARHMFNTVWQCLAVFGIVQRIFGSIWSHTIYSKLLIAVH